MLDLKTHKKMKIAKRLAQEIEDGQIVNLGIGIPSIVVDFIKGKEVYLQTENGLLGVGPSPREGEEDHDLIGASRNPVRLNKGGSIFDSSVSFSMIRGGHIDVAVLGTFQVDQTGEIANWAVPGQSLLGVGGSMDLLVGARKIIIGLTHMAKDGSPKLVKVLTYPTSGTRKADKVVTEKAVFEISNGQLVLTEIDPTLTVEQLSAMTEAHFEVSPQLLKNYI